MKKILSGFLAVTLFTVSIIFASPTHAANTSWGLPGEYTVDFTCTSGCTGTYTHTLTVENVDSQGNFTGTGFYNADDSYTWDVTGTLDGSNVTYTIVYTGTNEGYEITGTGTIASDGKISGTATDSSGNTFDMITISGAAVKLIKPTAKDECKNGGWQTFTNPTFSNQGRCVSYVNSQLNMNK